VLFGDVKALQSEQLAVKILVNGGHAAIGILACNHAENSFVFLPIITQKSRREQTKKLCSKARFFTQLKKAEKSNGGNMDKLKIALLDSNQNELELYGKLCLAVADKCGIQAELLSYSDSQSFLFDIDDPYFASALSVLIVEPDGGNAAIPITLRNGGYKGIILYLSRLSSEAVYLQAFDAKAFNFLKKGEAQMPRFHTVFEQTLKAAEKLHREYIVVSGYGEYRQIQISEIFYFECRDKLVTVHHSEGKFEFYSTLQRLEERLSDRGFIRVSKSFLVSVEAIHKPSYEKLILNDGSEIPVGRSYAPALKVAIDRWHR
jgi:hypothetical protein